MNTRKSKTQVIYDFFKEGILNGRYRKGSLLPTDLQISLKFKTSRPTVAKAMQKLVDEKYLDRKAGYGTFISDRKVGCKPEKGFKFGLIVNSKGEAQIFETLCNQIANLTVTYDFDLFLLPLSDIQAASQSLIKSIINKCIKQGLEGVFFIPIQLKNNCCEINNNIIKMFKAADIPIVLLDRDVGNITQKSENDVVVINDFEAGYSIGKHLIEKGCKKIAFITRPNIANSVNLRFKGVREAVLEAGLPLEFLEVFSFDGDINELALTIAERKYLQAVTIYNDAVAAELCIELENLGIKIPGDLKISAFDDAKYARLLKTPLTTYKRPHEDMARVAVETMISRIANLSQCPRKVLLDGKLITRASTN